MLQLSSVQLPSDGQTQIANNMRATLSARIELIPVGLSTAVWVDRLTVFEIWLLSKIDPVSYADVADMVPAGTLSQIDATWKWNDTAGMVAAPVSSSAAALFPTLSVAFSASGLSLGSVYLNPRWSVDPTAAWWTSHCDTGEWYPAAPYANAGTLTAIATLDGAYALDCATNTVTPAAGVTISTPPPVSTTFASQLGAQNLPMIQWAPAVNTAPVPVAPITINMNSSSVTNNSSSVTNITNMLPPVAAAAVQQVQTLITTYNSTSDTNIQQTLMPQITMTVDNATTVINQQLAQPGLDAVVASALISALENLSSVMAVQTAPIINVAAPVVIDQITATSTPPVVTIQPFLLSDEKTEDQVRPATASPQQPPVAAGVAEPWIDSKTMMFVIAIIAFIVLGLLVRKLTVYCRHKKVVREHHRAIAKVADITNTPVDEVAREAADRAMVVDHVASAETAVPAEVW